MKTRKSLTAMAAVLAVATSLAGCGGGSSPSASSSGEAFDSNVKTEISMSSWNLKATPEFQKLVDGFTAKYPNVTINLKEYSADDYDKQLTVDLSGGNAHDIVTMKLPAKYHEYASSGSLADITDIVKAIDGKDGVDASSYDAGGTYYAAPYRTDSWVMFYNKTMFEKAGVAIPDKDWTWDDFEKVSLELKSKLGGAGYDTNAVKASYFHNWQSVVQGISRAQTKDADFYSGDYGFMKPYYERLLRYQDEGLTVDWATSNATKVQYQGQFGTQKAAMMPMGTWYLGTLVSQQKSGDAENFEWGILPLPQNPDAAAESKPRTQGSSTGFSVSEKSSGQQRAAAKEFVRWATGEEGAKLLAGISITPANTGSAVEETFFSNEGMPTDDVSKYSWREHMTIPDAPIGDKASEMNSILNTVHSAIMTKTKGVDEGLVSASEQVKDAGIVD